MSWPTNGEFREAVQHPDRAFPTPELRASVAERNTMGVVRTRAGAFANVYKLVHPGTGKAQAVRVFLYPNPDREARYRTVHEHLKGLKPGTIGCLVKFWFEPKGIRVAGQSYPIQLMEWVGGVTLGVWVAEKVARRDTSAIRAMADRWVALVAELQAARIAHGDLQHGNIMVVSDRGEDKLRLVDYDCMCVPALVAAPAFESGMPAYQHPGRAGRPLALELDRFPAWVILTALRAVAADLSLWKTFVDDTQNENLCFHETDLRDPDRSALWPRLLASPDAEVRGFAARLREALRNDFDAVPPLELNASTAPRRATLRPAPARAPIAPAATPARPVDLIAALRAADHGEIRRLLNRRVLADHEAALIPHRAAIESWAVADLLKLPGPRPGDTPPAVYDARGWYRLRWAWPPHPLVAECLVAVSAAGFATEPTPARGCMTVPRGDFERGGGWPVPVYSADPLHVTVWAVTDLGWRKLVGPPWMLGPLRFENRPGPDRGPARPRGTWKDLLNW